MAGFDDSPVARVLWPQLTTMRQPVFAMTYHATDMLLQAIDTGIDPGAKLQLDFELVVRGSTAPPPAPGAVA